jgi:Putative MetA-pathway of phenol degradation
MSVAAVLSTGVTARAGSARDYLNAPVDSWLLNYNAGYTTSVTPEDGTDTVPGVRSNVFAQSVVLTRIMDYWGRTGGFSLVLPYALIDTSAGPFHANTNGVSDVGFLWQMNIFGGPALTREQFQSFIPQTFSSFHLLVTTPLGTYQPTSPINPSANRWMISPTVNFSYTPDQGWSWIETYVAGRIFTDNGNYLVNGAQTLTQRPLLRLEEHLSRNVTDALWLSADAYYNLGGETSIDGIDQDNMANTLRIGAGMGLRLWRGADMGLNYERVVAKPASEPYSQTVRLTVRQLWQEGPSKSIGRTGKSASDRFSRAR